MDFSFVINKPYLLVHALKAHQPSPFPEWEKLENRLWKLAPDAYAFMMGRPEFAFLSVANEDKAAKFLRTIAQDFSRLLDRAFRSREFRRLYKETKGYRDFIEKQWQKNREQVFGILEELLGFPVPEMTITVFITHPKLHNGRYFPKHNVICWGHSEDWKNYSTVYLAHELLHLLLYKKLKRDDLTHAIIELIADNELRIRLNKGGKYFVEKGKEVGHPHLRSMEKKILPYWRKYLKEEKKDIVVFYKKMRDLIKN